MNHKMMSALLAVVFMFALQGVPAEATDPGPLSSGLHVGSTPDGASSVIRVPVNWRERYPFSDLQLTNIKTPGIISINSGMGKT